MTPRKFNYIGNSRLRGGANGSCAITVCLIICIVLVAILLALMLIPVSDSSGVSTTGFARISKSMKKKDVKKKPVARARVAPKRSNSPRPRRVRAGTGLGAGVPDPRRVQHHAPMQAPPAPLPASQLMVPTNLPHQKPELEMMPNSIAVGDTEMNQSSTEAGGVVASRYADSNYEMDPGMMTTSSTTDIQGVETFMPNMSGGVGTENGPIDPSTGLPLFTTGKLVRSQMLGGYGAGSFLRQVQDPLAGYKRLGRNMCGAQNARKDLANRRTQFNAARLADPDGDPVLFNTSEFMYS